MARFPARRVGFLIRSIAALWLFGVAATANAAFPGDNGKIAVDTYASGFGSTNWDAFISTFNPDGSGAIQLTSPPSDFSPTWSPNGQKIAFMRSQGYDGTGAAYANAEVWTMNADGSGQTRLTNNSEYDSPTGWSPDGTKIVFTSTRDGNNEIYEMNADGSGQTRLTNNAAADYGAVWSPDGTKIAFASSRSGDSASSIYVMNPDGTGVTRFTQGPCSNPLFGAPDTDVSPDWSPNSQKIVFSRDRWTSCSTEAEFVGTELWSINRDGTGLTQLTSATSGDCCHIDDEPAWSPDGTTIAFRSDRARIQGGTANSTFVMNADGTGIRLLHDGQDGSPDWQPLKPYSRPVGASPLEVTLVPAFRPCETGNADAQHGQPLAFPSCSNPTPSSSTARIGPNTLSLMRIVVCPSNASSAFCNPAGGMPKPDVRFAGSIRDIHCATTVPLGCTPGADYNPNTATGPYTDGGNGKGGAQPPCLPSASSTTACLAGADLTEVAEIPGASIGGSGTQFEGRGVRITDRSNIPATVTDIGFPIPLDCLPTPSTTQGSTCGVNTTANALAPGVVTSGDAAVWQLGQIELKDSGPDGVRGSSDDELFATQGVFLP